MKNKMTALIILDGYGINKNLEGNAIAAAKKPVWDRITDNYPTAIIHTSGMSVGLPDGQMGNSEVGHTNIGAGRIVYQELTRITKSIKDGDFFDKKEFIEAINNCKKNNSKMHILGLLSDGGVHSHNTHLYGLLDLMKKYNFNDVYIHCFFDGRDVAPDSSIKYVKELESVLNKKGVGKIASIMGRYYAMDRDNRWERVEKAYKAMVMGKGIFAGNAEKGTLESYKKEIFDEFVLPTVIIENNKPIATIKEGDSIIFINFRPDRVREITRAFVDPKFDGFVREKGFFPLYIVCMTQYDKTFQNVHIAFKPQKLENTFGEYISRNGFTQLRIAETEKYAHVTFFFNGGVEKVYKGEDRALIPSPKVATYDLKPEMSAYKVADEAVKRIRSKKYDVMILNFANPDMVGHTGIFDAAKAAIEVIDECLGKVLAAIDEVGGVAFITADHGNAEKMIDYDTCGPFTAHTTNDVPLVGYGIKGKKLKEGKLADIAPTMLNIMGLPIPKEMTGENLLID